MTLPVATIRDALAERYAIERVLGEGGMATVYLAHDQRHDRPVAIKVLRPEFAAALGAERFAREIRVLARLRHPFILPLHDSGEAAGALYYVMPYVDGESLGGRLRRSGRLPVRDAVAIVRQVADALGYAHGEGVVHRDVKPENILLSRQGHALLADFGIARGETEPGRSGPQLTAVGLTLGTPAYMSPEQSVGEPGLAGASDIYSLGITLYEMLAGRPPFLPASAAAIAIQHLTAPVPALGLFGAEVPAAVEVALRRALAKDPDDRFTTAPDFAAALASTDPLAVTVPSPAVTAAPAVASLVVLPLANGSGDQESEYLSDGITEELIGALARVQGLRVISRTSAFAYKGKQIPLREIGATLGVTFALEGAVRRSGDRLRVTAQLVRVSDDSPLWSETYAREQADVFAVQDDITQRIVATLTRTLKLTSADTPEPMAKPSCLEAYNTYLLGRYHWNKRTRTGMEQALALFQRAVAIDPTYAPAHSGVADACGLMASNGYGPVELFRSAADAAARAIALDPSLAEGHASSGFVKLHGDWDWGGAERAFRRAIAINPGYVPAHQWLSAFLAAVGRFDEALPLAERAVALDPLSILARINLGTVHVFGNRIGLAVDHYRQAVAMEPTFVWARLWLSIALAMVGNADEAIVHARATAEVSDWEDDEASAALAAVYAVLGRREEAEAALASVVAAPEPYPMLVAMVCSVLGKEAQMYEWLERAYRERTDWIYAVAGHPAFAAHRGSPRFREFLGRLGLLVAGG